MSHGGRFAELRWGGKAFFTAQRLGRLCSSELLMIKTAFGRFYDSSAAKWWQFGEDASLFWIPRCKSYCHVELRRKYSRWCSLVYDYMSLCSLLFRSSGLDSYIVSRSARLRIDFILYFITLFGLAFRPKEQEYLIFGETNGESPQETWHNRPFAMAEITHIISSSNTPEMLRLGPIRIRILSAGGPKTSSLIMNLPRRTPGFPLHSHRMHTTSFLVLRGRIRFNSPSNSFDARAGSFIEVPAGSKYGFSNPFSQVAEVFVVYFPGFYVECLRELAALWAQEEGTVVSVQEQVDVMKGWGTVIVTEEGSSEGAEESGRDEEMEEDDDESEEEEDERGTALQCMA